jgi:hypothetical protein
VATLHSADQSRSVRGDSSLLIKLVNDQTQQSRHLHDKNIDAIQSLKSELLATMRQHQSTSLQSQDTLLYTLGDQLAKLAAHSTALEKSERILESLYCEEVHRRELGVSEAENRTFFWAFDTYCLGHNTSCGCSCLNRFPERSNGKCWLHDKALEPPCAGHESCQKHFLNWLERDTTEPFMITGKPGSGKSTFMKFITGHEQTQSALDTWSGGRRLVVASFYFWSSGTPLQRSQDGLLRCLLYKILSQAPETIPTAVPRRWQATSQLRTAEPWSRKEISDAFANVVNANSMSTKFCFFIDGLDEYGGSDLGSGESDLDLVLQLKTLSSSPCVKLCLSSRPRNVFQGHFPTNGPHHITLHNHTTKDIEQLVESRIDRVQGLIQIETADLEVLKHMIVERSSGVFLWVVLVVRELLDGLEPPFSMLELKKRLRMLPTTLDGYFQRILDRVHQQYRRFNARLLLLSLRRPQPLLCYVYSLWLLEHGEFDLHHHTIDIHDYGLGTGFWSADTEARIKKICGDFLIVKKGERACEFIEHNHRSVRDFLRLPAVKAKLLALAGWHTKSDIILMSLRLFVLSCQDGLMTLEDDTSFSHFTDDVAKYERCSGKTCADLIYKLDRVLCSRPPPTVTFGERHWTDVIIVCCHPEWVVCEAQALLLCMVLSGVTTFVDHALMSLSAEAEISVLNDLLRALLLGCYHAWPWRNDNSRAVKFLCSMGADVNSVAGAPSIPTVDSNADMKVESSRLGDSPRSGTDLGLDVANPTNQLDDLTIWEVYLWERKSKKWHTRHESAGCVTLAAELIEAGANLECRLPEDCDDIQQAIEKRLTSELTKLVGHGFGYGYNLKKTRQQNRKEVHELAQGLARTVLEPLSKRGVAVRDPDTDKSLKDARAVYIHKQMDPIRVALARRGVTVRDSDTDEPLEDARAVLSDEGADRV